MLNIEKAKVVVGTMWAGSEEAPNLKIELFLYGGERGFVMHVLGTRHDYERMLAGIFEVGLVPSLEKAKKAENDTYAYQVFVEVPHNWQPDTMMQ